MALAGHVRGLFRLGSTYRYVACVGEELRLMLMLILRERAVSRFGA